MKKYVINIAPVIILGVFAKLQNATVCFAVFVCLSVRLPSLNGSTPTGRVFIEFYIRVFCENTPKNPSSMKILQE